MPEKKTRRRETFEDMLDHLTDYEPAPKTGQGFGGGGMPRTPLIASHPAVKELHRVLDQLAREPTIELKSGQLAAGYHAHAHLVAFYHSEQRIDRGTKVKRWNKRTGRFEQVDRPPGEWTRKRIISPWTIESVKDVAVDYVEQHYRGEPRPQAEILAWVERVQREQRAKVA